MKINISLGANNTATIKDERARSLIKCIYVVLLMKLETLSDGRAKILRENTMPAVEFLKEHRLGSVQWKALFEAALTKKEFSKLDKQLQNVWDMMRTKTKAYSGTPALINLYQAIIKDFRAFCKGESESAYARLEKNAKETREIDIYSRFLPEEQDVSVQLKTLKNLIEAYEPDNRTLALSIDVAKELREEEPLVYKHYLKVKNDIKKGCDKEIMAYVRTSGKTLLDVRDVVKHLNGIGMPNTIPEGFVGQLDENGNYYTVKGKKHPGRQLKTKPGGKCTMNPAYDVDKDNTYVLKSKTPGAANVSSFYTVDYGSSSQQDKYELVKKNIPHFEVAREKWIKDILNDKGEKFMLAVLCEMLYLSMARIGTKNVTISQKGDYQGKQTYGIRTLQCKHVKIEPTRITIAYLGVKTTARLKHFIYKDTLQDKKIYQYIVNRVNTAERDDPLFAYKGKLISPAKVNAYLKSLGLTITAHKFRTIRGTKLFIAKSEKSGVLKAKTTSDKKRVASEIDKILEAVGKELGHYSTTQDGLKFTGSTALQYYVIPSYVLDLYDKFSIRYPAKIQKIYDQMVNGNSDDGDDD